jgi:hypothetical protein
MISGDPIAVGLVPGLAQTLARIIFLLFFLRNCRGRLASSSLRGTGSRLALAFIVARQTNVRKWHKSEVPERIDDVCS